MKINQLPSFSSLRDFFMAPLPEVSDNLDADILTSDAKIRRAGYFVVLFFFSGFFLWAGLAPLESAALGRGTVSVEGSRKVVQHLEGGIIREILVENGDAVFIDQPLLKLDTTLTQAELSIVEGKLWTASAVMDRLISERDDLEAPSFRSALTSVTDQRAITACESETALFEMRRAARLGEIALLEQQIEQIESQAAGVQAVLEAKADVADSLRLEKRDLESLLQDGFVDKQRIRQLERSLAETLGEISDLTAKRATALIKVAETQLKVAQLEKQFKTEVVDALAKAQEEFFEVSQKHTAVADRVARATVRAPAEGTVLALRENTIGAVISPGEDLMEVVPFGKRLIIDTKLSPLDIDRIYVGQAAEVRFAVFKDAYTISGKLVTVSADILDDDETGERYYEGKVELLEGDLQLLGDSQLVPGMPAEVLIKTGTRTLLGYITSPLARMFETSLIED